MHFPTIRQLDIHCWIIGQLNIRLRFVFFSPHTLEQYIAWHYLNCKDFRDFAAFSKNNLSYGRHFIYAIHFSEPWAGARYRFKKLVLLLSKVLFSICWRKPLCFQGAVVVTQKKKLYFVLLYTFISGNYLSMPCCIKS